MSSELLSRSNKRLVPSKVRFRPDDARIETFEQQQLYPLAYLARLHHWGHGTSLHHRECHSSLWRPGLTHRRLARHSLVIPAYGIHVALRQLVTW